MLFLCSVDAITKYDVAIEEVFRDEIDDHGQRQDQVFIPAEAFAGEHGGPPGGKGRKYQIETGYFQHGNGDVVCGTECKLSVQGKVPDYGEHQGDQVRQPVVQMQDFLHQSKTDDLNQSGADRE